MYLPLPPFICSPNCVLFHLNLFRMLYFSVFFGRSFSPLSFHLHLRHHQREHLRKGASLWAIGVLRENPITIFRHSLPFIAAHCTIAILYYCTIALTPFHYTTLYWPSIALHTSSMHCIILHCAAASLNFFLFVLVIWNSYLYFGRLVFFLVLISCVWISYVYFYSTHRHTHTHIALG